MSLPYGLDMVSAWKVFELLLPPNVPLIWSRYGLCLESFWTTTPYQCPSHMVSIWSLLEKFLNYYSLFWQIVRSAIRILIMPLIHVWEKSCCIMLIMEWYDGYVVSDLNRRFKPLLQPWKFNNTEDLNRLNSMGTSIEWLMMSGLKKSPMYTSLALSLRPGQNSYGQTWFIKVWKTMN